MLFWIIAYLYISGVLLFMVFIDDFSMAATASTLEKWLVISSWPFIVPIALFWYMIERKG
jgi:hypothetical protein